MKTFYPLLLLCYLLIPFNSPAQKKYNVIYIAADDLNIQFDAFGNPYAPAPNFARLLKHGMLFQQTYCQYPLCSPSRTSISSGQRPDSTGVSGNIISIRSTLGPSYKFLPEYFDAHGYRTEKYGKVASCRHEEEISWDYVLEGEVDGGYSLGGTPDWWIDTTAKNVMETEEGQITSVFVERLKHPSSSPYFYGLGLETHNPYTPILSTWNKLGDKSTKELLPTGIGGTPNIRGNGSGNIPLPATPRNDTADIPAIALKDPIIYPDEEVKRVRHAYYGEIMQLDEELGAVLDVMDSLNLWDSTIVVFWSDHGVHLGEHEGQWLKLTLFEESLRVPFVICAPGKKTGVCTTPVELVDIFSTLAELCGLPAPPEQHGSSLVPLLEKPDIKWKKAVFAQVLRYVNGAEKTGRSVRTNNYHYNSWQQAGEELYNIEIDPHEYTNLAEDPASAPVLNRMRNILAKGWQGALPPPYPQSNFYKDEDGDGYGKTSNSIVAYFAPDGYAKKSGDCNDNDAKINPGTKEQPCNGKDDNCDNQVDETTPQPVITAVGNLDICQTGSVLLKTNSYPDAAYQWKRDGNKIAGATLRTYTATQTGNYKVDVSVEDCKASSDRVIVTSSCNLTAGNNEISSSQLIVTPNPSKGTVTVTYNSYRVGKADIKVYDRIGKLILNKTNDAVAGKNIYLLNLSFLKPGVYNIELKNGTEILRNKIVIEN